MIQQLYNVGDHVRAAHARSNILECAVVTEIVEKWIGYVKKLDSGRTVEGPLYWVRFDVGGMVVPRWQNELVAATVTRATV